MNKAFTAKNHVFHTLKIRFFFCCGFHDEKRQSQNLPIHRSQRRLLIVCLRQGGISSSSISTSSSSSSSSSATLKFIRIYRTKISEYSEIKCRITPYTVIIPKINEYSTIQCKIKPYSTISSRISEYVTQNIRIEDSY